MSRALTYAQAISETLALEMRRDPRVYVAGEDVGLFGGFFGATKGLIEEFGPQRVIDTPISEPGIIGTAVGAAMAGLRPVVEIMFFDFIAVAVDEVVNQAAKMRYMSGGQLAVPLVIRTPGGAGIRAAAQHSQSLEAWFLNVPGLKIAMPATPAEAKGLLTTAIRDDDPVLFIEHKLLYGQEGEVPEGEYAIPFGRARVARPGRDVTIVALSLMVGRALAAARTLAAEGIEAEVIDPRTLRPLDLDTIMESVRRTRRLAIVHEATRTGGVGAEIAAAVGELAWGTLAAPIRRVAAPDVPVPFSGPLEDYYLPREEEIAATVRELVNGA